MFAEVAGPGLGGGQVAVLHPHAAVSWPRNKDILFLNEKMYMGLADLSLMGPEGTPLWALWTPALFPAVGRIAPRSGPKPRQRHRGSTASYGQ